MDYEKAYKNALNRAKEYHFDGAKQCITDTLEYIFPELAESEDELTWLTKYIEEEVYSLSMDIRDNEDRIKLKKLQKALAWLEKQGSQQPTIIWHSVSEEPEEMKELFCEWESDDATWHDVAFYDEESKTFRHAKMPINVTKWVYVDELLERQGEQKPTVTDFNAKDWYVSKVDGKIHDMTYNSTDRAEPNSPSIIEENPAWSDEDENYLQSAENACEYQYGKNTSTILWLKRLKDRIGG